METSASATIDHNTTASAVDASPTMPASSSVVSEESATADALGMISPMAMLPRRSLSEQPLRVSDISEDRSEDEIDITPITSAKTHLHSSPSLNAATLVHQSHQEKHEEYPKISDLSTVMTKMSDSETLATEKNDTTRLSRVSSSQSDASSSSSGSSSNFGTKTTHTTTKKKRDSTLKIFFPTDDLALKAILSPPHLRSTNSTGSLLPPPTSLTKAASVDSTINRHASSISKTASTTNAVGPVGGSTIGDHTNSVGNIFNQGAKLILRSVSATVNAAGGQNSAPTGGSKTSTAVSVDEDVDKVNNNVVVMHSNLPPPPFANMFSCDNCREDIGTLLSKGRHHCRNCGGSFCADCSGKMIIVPFQVYLNRGEQRVCDGCYHRIKDFHAQVQRIDVTWSGLQPPSNAVFIKDFELPAHETPVTIFNCSLFMDLSPFYGHLFLTREHLCFKGYKCHKIKIPYAKLVSLIKPQFYYINALQVKTTRKEKFFFAEFNGLRDLCFLRLDQLIRAYQEGKKLCIKVNAEDLVQQALVRRRSYKMLEQQAAAGSTGGGAPPLSSSTSMLTEPLPDDDMANFVSGKTTVGFMDIDDEENEEDEEYHDEDDEILSSRVTERRTSYDDREDVAVESDDDKNSTSSDEEPFQPPPPDQPLLKTTILLDCELRADVRAVFDLLWNDGIGQDFLHNTMVKARDIDIAIDSWQAMRNPDDWTKGFSVSKENDYSLYRYVKSQHPPKMTFPGLPPYATCSRLQRFRLDKSSQSGEKWDRFVISDLLSMSKIPFSDYFEIETRWVFSRDGKNYCHVQAGLVVNFLKSTWFKSQINSSTMSETKEVLEAWAKQAMEHLQTHAAKASTIAPSPVVTATTSTGRPLSPIHEENIEASVDDKPKRKLSASTTQSPTQSPRKKALKDKQPIEIASEPTAASSTTLTAQAMDLWASISYVQWIMLALLLYCVVLLRGQQAQLQELTMTTKTLFAKLEEQASATSASIAASAATPGREMACDQRVLDGAVDTLRHYFKATC